MVSYPVVIAVAWSTLSCKFSARASFQVMVVADMMWNFRSDIEQEVNGVYAFDRKAKIDPERVKALFDKAAKKYLDGLGTYSSTGAALPTSGDSSEAALPTGVAKPA